MHGDSLLMLTTKVVSNKKPPLLSDSESGGSTSQSETVLDILKIEADEIAGIAAADWLKLEDISEEACSELEKTLTAAVMKWLDKHGLKPDFYESISSVQAHGIDDYFRKK